MVFFGKVINQRGNVFGSIAQRFDIYLYSIYSVVEVCSKIALFGCDPILVLNTIEAIELKEGLPHPLFIWQL